MSEPIAFAHAAVVVGDKDGTVLPDTTVVVDGTGTIVDVGPSDEVVGPSGTRVMDLTGKHLMPGLINAHAHLFSDGKPLPPILINPSAEKLVTIFMHSPIGRRWLNGRTKRAVTTQLNTGVTTIRSVGDPGYEVVRAAAAIANGDYVGPRLIPSGPLLAIPGGHGAPQIALVGTGAETVRGYVRENLRNGSQAIKISATGGVTDATSLGHAGTPEMSEADMRAICDEAHSAGVLVAAHAQSVAGIVAALRAGVDTIEHGAGMNEEIIALFKDNPKSLRGYSALIPTLMVCLPLVKFETSVTGINDINQQNAVMVYDEMLAGIKDALANDIEIGMGTDSSLTFATHYNTWRELDLVVRYGGLTPARAIHAATAANARILGIDQETGAVQTGLQADFVITATNPVENLRTLAEPSAVVVRGIVIEHPTVERFAEIDELLDTL